MNQTQGQQSAVFAGREASIAGNARGGKVPILIAWGDLQSGYECVALGCHSRHGRADVWALQPPLHAELRR
jgi:hypothetical protein